jgi:hypothetical protein
MDESGTLGLLISLLIGIALFAACGVVAFTLMLVGLIAF